MTESGIGGPGIVLRLDAENVPMKKTPHIDWTFNVGNIITIICLLVSTVIALRSYEKKLDATLAAFDKRIELQEAAYDKRIALLEQLAVEYIPDYKQTRDKVDRMWGGSKN